MPNFDNTQTFNLTIIIDKIKTASLAQIPPFFNQAQYKTFNIIEKNYLNNEKHIDIEIYTQNFLKNKQQVLLFLGNPGSGKTTYCYHLLTKLWQVNTSDSLEAIPLYIPLSTVSNKKFLVETILKNYGLNEEQIDFLKKKQQFIFIIDNYAEDGHYQNIFIEYQLMQWQSKIIITCRQQHLANTRESDIYFSPFRGQRRQPALLQKAHIAPLTIEQIHDYANVYCKLELEKETTAQQTFNNLLADIPALVNFANNFLSLRLILENISSLQKLYNTTNHVESVKNVYEYLLNSWFAYQENKLIEMNKIKKETTFKDDCWAFICTLAQRMHSHGSETITYIPSSKIFSKNTSPWEVFFSDTDPYVTLLRNACPLFSLDEHCYTLIDVEFISFLTSYPSNHQLPQLQTLSTNDQLTDLPALEIITSLKFKTPAELLYSDLNKMLFVNNVSKMQWLTDLIVTQPKFKQILLELLFASRYHEDLKIASANAITALNTAGESFSDLDLTGVWAEGANLQFGTFHRTILRKAHLKGANFRNAYIAGADFSYADMEDVIFGEYAHIKVDDTINECCYSPNGQLLATALWYTKAVIVYDLATQKIETTFTGHTDVVESVHFHPNANIIASASRDGTIRIWDLSIKSCVLILDEHLDQVQCVRFSQDGNYLASCSDDGTVRIWDVTSNYQCLHILIGHTDKVKHLDFDKSNRYLVSADGAAIAKLWDLLTGECIRDFKADIMSVFCLCVRFSPDNKMIAASYANNEIVLWNVENAECIKILKGHTGWPDSLDFSADGRHLISGAHNHIIRAWSLDTFECEQVLQGHSSLISFVQYSPDQQIIVSASRDKTIRFWPANINKWEQHLENHTRNIQCMSFSPDGYYLATGSEDETVRIWSAKKRVCKFVLRGHKGGMIDHGGGSKSSYSGNVECLQFSPDGQWLASGSGDRTIKIWNLKTGKCEKTLTGHSGLIKSISYHPSGEFLVSASYDKTLKVWNIAQGKSILTLVGHTEYIHCVRFSSQGNLIASAAGSTQVGRPADNTVRIWDSQTGDCLHILRGHTRTVWIVEFSPDQTQLVSLGSDNAIKVWNVNDGALLHTIKDIRDQFPRHQIGRFSKNILAKTKPNEPPEEWLEENGHVLTFSPDSKYLISGEGVLPLRVWSMENYQLLKYISVDNASLYTFTFSPETQLATAVNADSVAI